MNPNIEEQERLAGQILRSDLNLTSRSSEPANTDIEHLCTFALDRTAQMPLIYTAFDGDHQMACGHMRRYVLMNGGVPANPDSILGYKDTVEHRITKRGVLLDDLAILRRCDELWVFSDLPCNPDTITKMAEGVVIELLFYLKRKSRPIVRFISVSKLFQGERPDQELYTYTYEETKERLLPTQREGVLELANSRGRVDKELPALIYHILDPLDYKYSQWLRSECYGANRAPLIPYLAIEPQDLPCGDHSLGRIVLAWVKLCELATRARLLPPVDHWRNHSLVASLLERVWVRQKDKSSIERGDWGDYLIPKVQMGSKWPLTKLEGGTR